MTTYREATEALVEGQRLLHARAHARKRLVRLALIFGLLTGLVAWGSSFALALMGLPLLETAVLAFGVGYTWHLVWPGIVRSMLRKVG